MNSRTIGSCLLLVLPVLATCGSRGAPVSDGAGDRARRDGPASSDRAAAREAYNTSVFFALFVEQLGADCMPIVPPDPVTINAHVEGLNNGSLPVGPIQVGASARVLSTSGQELATFSVQPIRATVLQPGGGMSEKIIKVAGSFTPGVACSLCGKPLQFELAYSGTNLPSGLKVTSPAATLSCAY